MFLYSGEAEIPCDRAEMREAGGGPGRGLLCEYFKKESLRLKHDFNFFAKVTQTLGSRDMKETGKCSLMFGNLQGKRAGTRTYGKEPINGRRKNALLFATYLSRLSWEGKKFCLHCLAFSPLSS